MSATVYATFGGLRYHGSPECSALVSGQELNDWDCPGDYCLHTHARTHAAVETTVTEALGAGKTPCLACLPAVGAGLARSACEEDFGHEPVWIEGDMFCRRCRTRGVDDDGDPWTYPRLWPCTSAVVLGLVPAESGAR